MAEPDDAPDLGRSQPSPDPRRLLTCTVCGAEGREGDECGRRPYGHRLTIARLAPQTRTVS